MGENQLQLKLVPEMTADVVINVGDIRMTMDDCHVYEHDSAREIIVIVQDPKDLNRKIQVVFKNNKFGEYVQDAETSPPNDTTEQTL